MKSLGLKLGDFTTASWRICYSRLARADLLATRKELQHKLAARF